MMRHARRRIIYNDDSDAQLRARSAEEFLSWRFDWCRSSHVDSYFWCVGMGQKPAIERPTAVPGGFGDPNQIILNAAREAGIEIFASLRMNDTHDAFLPHAMPAMKIEHPEFLVGTRKDYPIHSVSYFTWSAFDYAHEEVRRHRLAFIGDVCQKYDWDGFEMDFCRHPIYFKPGEARAHLSTMTVFVGDVRNLLDSIGTKRGRPYLLAAHVPDTVEHSVRAGLDIEKWLSKRYLDLVIAGGGYRCHQGLFRELIELGHRFGVPVYPAFDVAEAHPLNTGDNRVAERIRGAASNIWAEGGDGVSLFNPFIHSDPGDPSIMVMEPAKAFAYLGEIGDPTLLRGLDKLYQCELCIANPLVQYAYPPHPLPVRLIDCAPIPLNVGDPVDEAASKGALRELLLRLRVTELSDEEAIEVRVNEMPVDVRRAGIEKMEVIGNFLKGGGVWFEGEIPSPLLGKGRNIVRVLPSAGCWGKTTTEVQDVQLLVRYK